MGNCNSSPQGCKLRASVFELWVHGTSAEYRKHAWKGLLSLKSTSTLYLAIPPKFSLICPDPKKETALGRGGGGGRG